MLYLPEAHTDFVFAIFAEEFGFVGVVCLLGLYSMLVLKIFQLGKKAAAQEYWYGAFLMIGFGLLISGQTFINLGVNAGLLPTGVDSTLCQLWRKQPAGELWHGRNDAAHQPRDSRGYPVNQEGRPWSVIACTTIKSAES